MKIPRDLKGEDLAKRLAKEGYGITRQTGSHMRLTRSHEGAEFHVTIPKHNPLRVGTLNNILKSIAEQLKISKEKLIQRLFG